MALPHGVAISLDDLDADFDSATVARCALLLTAANAARHAPPDRWRTVLTSVLDELTVSDADVGAPIGLEFSVTPATTYRPVDAVGLRAVTVGKRGTWIKSGLNWRRILYNSDTGEFNHRQYLAVRALATELQRSCPVMAGETLMIAASPAFWSLLTDAADAGVTMVADSSRGMHTVEFIKQHQIDQHAENVIRVGADDELLDSEFHDRFCDSAATRSRSSGVDQKSSRNAAISATRVRSAR
jgi:hypothetical protein